MTHTQNPPSSSSSSSENLILTTNTTEMEKLDIDLNYPAVEAAEDFETQNKTEMLEKGSVDDDGKENTKALPGFEFDEGIRRSSVMFKRRRYTAEEKGKAKVADGEEDNHEHLLKLRLGPLPPPGPATVVVQKGLFEASSSSGFTHMEVEDKEEKDLDRELLTCPLFS